jgi:hypothetical protein
VLNSVLHLYNEGESENGAHRIALVEVFLRTRRLTLQREKIRATGKSTTYESLP